MTDWRAVRRLVPEVLGALARRYGHFDACEDAVQEALVAAAAQWPVQGWPANPRGWLVTVASRRLADQLPRGRTPDHQRARETPPPHPRRAAGLTDRRDDGSTPSIRASEPVLDTVIDPAIGDVW